MWRHIQGECVLADGRITALLPIISGLLFWFQMRNTPAGPWHTTGANFLDPAVPPLSCGRYVYLDDRSHQITVLRDDTVPAAAHWHELSHLRAESAGTVRAAFA